MMAEEKEPKQHKGPTARPASIRMAGPADEMAVFDLVMRDLFENAQHIATIDPLRVMDHIRAGTQRRGGITAVIDGQDGKPVAVTVIVPVQWAFSQAFHAQEVFNYVHPDHRSSRHAEDLIKFGNWCADEWSRNFGYQVYILSSVLTQRKVREKLRFYRRFITQLGAIFLYPSPGEIL